MRGSREAAKYLSVIFREAIITTNVAGDGKQRECYRTVGKLSVKILVEAKEASIER